MVIDRYYTLVDGKWARIFEHEFVSNFWVDIFHSVDERYYFPDLASAIDFYREGWKQRQCQNPDGSWEGLDRKGLYSDGRLTELEVRSKEGTTFSKPVDGETGKLNDANETESVGKPTDTAKDTTQPRRVIFATLPKFKKRTAEQP